jgi:hypothetical protein
VQCDGADKNSCRGTLFFHAEIINNLLQHYVKDNQVFLLDVGRGIVPLIHNCGIIWRRVVNFMLQPLYPLESAQVPNDVEG